MRASKPISQQVTIAINGVAVTASVSSVRREFKPMVVMTGGLLKLNLELMLDADDAQSLISAIHNPPPPPKLIPIKKSEPHPLGCECQTCRVELEDGDQ